MRETTVLELQHPVRPGRERAIVRHDHHAQLELVRELGEQLVQPLAVVMVEISRRLVGEEHGRIGGVDQLYEADVLLAYVAENLRDRVTT